MSSRSGVSANKTAAKQRLRNFIRYVLSACNAAVSAASSGTVPVPGEGVPSRRDAAKTRNRDGRATLNRYFMRSIAHVRKLFFIGSLVQNVLVLFVHLP